MISHQGLVITQIRKVLAKKIVGYKNRNRYENGEQEQEWEKESDWDRNQNGNRNYM